MTEIGAAGRQTALLPSSADSRRLSDQDHEIARVNPQPTPSTQG